MLPSAPTRDCRWRAGTCHQHGKTGKAGADGQFPIPRICTASRLGVFSAALFCEGAPLCPGDHSNPLGH